MSDENEALENDAGAEDSTDSAPDLQPPTEHDGPRTRRKKRRVLRASFWMLAGFVLGLGFLWLASMSLTGRVARLPDWVVERVETRLNAGLQDGSLSLSRIEFGVSSSGFPRLSLMDLSYRDGSGLEIAQIHRVQGGTSPLSLLRGNLEPSRLYLTGAQVTLRRRVNGEFDLSFGRGGGASGDLASVLDAVDGVFAEGPLAMAEEIEADELTIILEDARTGRLWQVTDGRLKLSQGEKIVDMTLAFDVFNQTEELAEIVLGFRTDKASSEASFGATFRNAAAADIAAQSPFLTFLGVIDAPISGALRSSINSDGEISELAGTLELGSGALSPASGAKPVRFDLAKIYIDYDPDAERIDFTHFNVVSELGEASGDGHVYLTDFNQGWPATLLAQFQLTEAKITSTELFEHPVEIEGGAADFRLRLDPFTLELGQLVLNHQNTAFTVAGEVSADYDGWSLALDAKAAQISGAQAMALWPLTLAPKPRTWVTDFVSQGVLEGLRAGVRLEAGAEPRLSAQTGFRDGTIRVIKEMLPVEGASGYMSIEDQTFMAVAEGGHVTLPSGRQVDIAGTVFTVPHMPTKPSPAHIDLEIAGPVTAILKLLDAEPFNVFKNSDLGPDLATGYAKVSGQIDLVVKPKLLPEDVDFSARAEVTSVRSDVLVPGRVLMGPHAVVNVNNQRIEVSGDVRIGAARGSGTWFAGIGEAQDGTSRLEANLVLNQAFLDEFNIGLPEGSLSGEGIGQLVMEFAPDKAPTYELVSDLNRLQISIEDLGWSKARNRTGRLRVTGHLGKPAAVDHLEFEAPGLSATGRVSVLPDGGLDEAEFSRVQLDGWLDAPVTFTGRGPDQTAAISINGGSADMRRASFTGSTGSDSDDAPIRVVLDKLIITEGIELTSLTGNLNSQGGLSGTFTALVNGGPAIRGVVAPQANGSAIRITSSNAGGVLKAAEVFETGRGGDMTLVLAPLAAEGTYDGKLTITDIRMVGASAMAELLSAISIVGLLEQLDQEGILFSEVESRFRLTPTQVIIRRASAIGASLGISLDGTYTLGGGGMDMAGVISPIYILNVLGQVFTRKGEGLIGFTYTMAGTPEDPEIEVNPLSLFTPAMFREIFRRPPPELPDE
ncbi:MAG: hypothetical protein GY945_15300 [Rhodobacteraceae bacterium]|nr:hypothetical protein [Paracoccaceae bacterium]